MENPSSGRMKLGFDFTSAEYSPTAGVCYNCNYIC